MQRDHQSRGVAVEEHSLDSLDDSGQSPPDSAKVRKLRSVAPICGYPRAQLCVLPQVEPLAHGDEVRARVERIREGPVALHRDAEDIAQVRNGSKPAMSTIVGHNGKRDQCFRSTLPDLLPDLLKVSIDSRKTLGGASLV